MANASSYSAAFLFRLYNDSYAIKISQLNDIPRLKSNSVSAFVQITGLLVVIACVTQFILRYLERSRRASEFRKFSAEHGCQVPGTPVRYSIFGSIGHKISLFANRKKDLLGDVFGAKFRKYGPTHVLYDSYDISRVCHTIEPENVHAVLALNAKDFRAPDARLVAIGPIGSKGVVVTEGSTWTENRKIITTGFKNARSLDSLETVVQELLENVSTSVDAEGWTKPFAMFHTLAQMTLDHSTKHMFGVSSGLQMSEREDRQEHSLWKTTTDTVAGYVAVRSLLGARAWIYDSFEFRKACSKLRSLCEVVIRQALSDVKKGIITNATFVGILVQETADAIRIRDVVLDLFIAGHNMTSGVLSWTWFELERHPEIFHTLRQEILDTFGTVTERKREMTYENLKQCQLLHNVIYEAMRLYPTLPNIGRQAIRDTTLPTGGGPDGKSPIAIAAGTVVMASLFQMHRREEEWGDDTNEFKPDRWIGRVPKYEYAPFGGGPRICPGQLFGLVELFYTTAKLLQSFSDIRVPKEQEPIRTIGAGLLMPPGGAVVQLKLDTSH